MWMIVVFLLIFTALCVFAAIAKTWKMISVFFCLGMAVAVIAVFLARNNPFSSEAILGIPFLSFALSNLITRPILRRRVVPPCVRVENLDQGGWERPIVLFVLLASFVFMVAVTESLHSAGIILFMGFVLGSLIISYIIHQVGKAEICGNGVWHSGRLHPWDEYESFSWEKKTEDSVELRLVSKSRYSCSMRLMAPPENRDAARQLLGANLPDLSTTKMNS